MIHFSSLYAFDLVVLLVKNVLYHLLPSEKLSSPTIEQASFYEDFLAHPIFMYNYLTFCMLVTSPAALTMACMLYFTCLPYPLFPLDWEDFKGRDCNLHIQHVSSLPITILDD